MEILASALMLASVVLPVLLVLAVATFAGLLIYSWISDLRGTTEPEPTTVAQEIPVQAPASRPAASAA